MLSQIAKKRAYMAAGFFSLGLGFIGVFLPVMPTTPFLIVAAFCFSRGSKKWHEWLMNHPVMGHALRDWEYHGVIRKRAKITATVLICISMVTTSVFVPVPMAVKIAVPLILACALLFIWTRPSVPRPKPAESKDLLLDDSPKTQ